MKYVGYDLVGVDSGVTKDGIIGGKSVEKDQNYK